MLERIAEFIEKDYAEVTVKFLLYTEREVYSGKYLRRLTGEEQLRIEIRNWVYCDINYIKEPHEFLLAHDIRDEILEEVCASLEYRPNKNKKHHIVIEEYEYFFLKSQITIKNTVTGRIIICDGRQVTDSDYYLAISQGASLYNKKLIREQ